jgi:hypothetical protein
MPQVMPVPPNEREGGMVELPGNVHEFFRFFLQA